MSAPRVDPHIRAAVVRRWHDADTVYVDIDRGMGEWGHNVPIRLRAEASWVWAAELAHGGITARDVAVAMAPPGTPVVVQTFTERPNTFARYSGIVWLPDGRDVGEELIELGFATRTRPVKPT